VEKRARGLRVVAPENRPPIARLVDEYLAHCRAAGLSPSTVKNSYGYPLREVFLPWCSQEGISDVSELNNRKLDRLGEQLMSEGGVRGELSRHSVWTYMKAVKRFLAWAKEEGEKVDADPKLPRLPRKVIDVLTRSEIQALEDAAAGERDALIVRTLADTGIRVGELVTLRLQDFVERNRNYFLHVQGKGQRERMVPISPSLYRRFRKYTEKIRPKDAVSRRIFIGTRRRPGGDFEPLTTSGVNQLIRNLGERAEIGRRVHPHLFRHSAATYMLQRGMDSILVAQILGHSSLAMIQKVYAHLTPTDAYDAMMRALRESD
jgi:integrase/recombinase XerD